MSWVQLILTVDQCATDHLSDVLADIGALAVTLADAEAAPIFEPSPGSTPTWARTEVTALFADQDSLGVALEQLRVAFAPTALPDYRTETLPDRQWEDQWRQHYAPIDCGHGLWICPTGQAVDVSATTVVNMEPGLAFGTGTHPTTALCLRWLAAAPLEGCRVIDFGCGSGILGIAALKRGAAQVWAVDHDNQALTATRENAERNEVSERLEVLTPNDSLVEDSDVLLANILLNPLLDLVEVFARSLRPDGAIVLCGVLDEQVEQLRATYQSYFYLEDTCSLDQWSCVTGRRRTMAD